MAKEKIDKSTIIVGGFNASVSKVNRTIKQKINKDIKDLITTVSQLALIDIATILYTKTIECRFSSSMHQRFAEVDLILSNKIRLNKIEKILTLMD